MRTGKPILLALFLVIACAPGTDPVYNRRPVAGGSHEGRFAILKSPLVQSQMGHGIDGNREILSARCVPETAATVGDLALESQRVEIYDASRTEILRTMDRVFPAEHYFGNDRSPLAVYAAAVSATNEQQSNTLLIVSRQTGKFVYTNDIEASSKPECENFVIGMHVGAYFVAAIRVNYPEPGQREEFRKRFGANSPFVPGADPKNDSVMSQTLKDMGARIEVAALQLGADPRLVSDLATLGTRCAVENLAACRNIFTDLEADFESATQGRPARLSEVGGRSRWQLTGYIPVKPVETISLITSEPEVPETDDAL